AIVNESRAGTAPAITLGRVQACLLAAILAVGIVFLLLQVLQTWNVLRSDSSRFGRLTALTRGALGFSPRPQESDAVGSQDSEP
ncbi:MAG: hypothetical protein ACYDGU_13590, partial [Acidiferrobacterales bacterium]